jgi:integrase
VAGTGRPVLSARVGNCARSSGAAFFALYRFAPSIFNGPMPPARLPYLHHEQTRHGKMVWVVRVGHGPRTRLRSPYGSAAFMREYREAVEKPRIHGQPRDDEGTFAWLWSMYRSSPAWAQLSPATKKQRNHLMSRSLELAGNQPLEIFTRKFIIAGRDARAATPSQATNWLKTMRAMFRWAIDAEHIESDPTVGIKPIKQGGSDGWHTWTAGEMVRFESRWPTGTRERLAYDVLLWTGLRRGDAARLGPLHVVDGEITIETEKTGRTITLPMLAPLAASLAASPVGVETFIASADGRPMAKESFGNWFEKVCETAGVPGRAHGLRKAMAVKLAESGATDSEIEAVLGNEMAPLYRRRASDKRLAATALARLGIAD